MIKGVLFDLDNTLIDFMAMKKKCSSAAVSAMVKAGLKMSEKRALKVLFELYDCVGIEYKYIFQKFLRKYGKVDYKVLSAGIVAYRKAQIKYMQPYPAVKPTLQKLKRKGLKLAIVSDAPRKYHTTVKQIKSEFSDSVKTYQTWIAYREHVFNPFPSVLEK